MKYLLQDNELQVLNFLAFDKSELRHERTIYGTFLNRYKFDKLIKSNSAKLSSICQSVFNKTLEDWLNEKRVYKYAIYKYVDKYPDAYLPPIAIDFTTGLSEKLFKKTLPLVNGKPTSVEYYAKKELIRTNAIGDLEYAYSDIICRIDFTLEYSDIGFITKREPVIKWYYENGELSHIEKPLTETFSMQNDFTKITDEGILRRGNIISELQYPMLEMLTAIHTDKTLDEILIIGRSFLDEMDAVFKGFIERALTVVDVNSNDFGKKVAYVEIRDYNGSHATWLDIEIEGVTPRQFIMIELDI